uniref:adenosylmethionine decarboxylase n=2 Tax=Phaeomonas parva TaxID=124430 RepID=A0A7S1UFX8_9STRA|mmetsp:Transcript_46241/g.144633  ORF Transcript_46241/g.144633 Transcript_46241/m.144633 type:complete len:434 (+) Transcript_46241:338-1639(+)
MSSPEGSGSEASAATDSPATSIMEDQLRGVVPVPPSPPLDAEAFPPGPAPAAPTPVDMDADGSELDEDFPDDESVDREYDGTFEGPEKTLEVCFKPGVGLEGGCRNLPRASLNRILTRAKCTIMSIVSNSHLDAYVLSESSLFVYPYKVVLKTCGATTLLRCLPYLLREARRYCGCELEWVGYSRKNFAYPTQQLFPHTSFNDEMGYLQKHSKYYDKLSGSAHILGPLTGDHWFVYVADKSERPMEMESDRTINIMMFDMHEDAAQMFYKDKYPTAEEQTMASGINMLMPGAQIDAQCFEPCGYSMNAIQHDSYSTIHITPESACSYASFETNTKLRSYTALIRNVLQLFRPRRFVLTMFADEAGLASLSEDPFEDKALLLPRFGMYIQRNAASNTTVEVDTVCRMGCWELSEDPFEGGLRDMRQSTRTHTVS